MSWRTCPQWPDYEVSDCGDIRRVVRKFGHEGIRKPYITSTGYLYIVMRRDGLARAVAVHRLVAEAFIGAAPSLDHQVAHGDGNRLNNAAENLRWATRSENEMDRVKHGTSNRGERFGRSRLTEAQVVVIKRMLADGYTPSYLARRYDVATTTIKSIKSGKSWGWLAIARENAR